MPRALRTMDLPAVDERLVAPESGAEILDGRLLMPPPELTRRTPRGI